MTAATPTQKLDSAHSGNRSVRTDFNGTFTLETEGVSLPTGEQRPGPLIVGIVDSSSSASCSLKPAAMECFTSTVEVSEHRATMKVVVTPADSNK